MDDKEVVKFLNAPESDFTKSVTENFVVKTLSNTILNKQSFGDLLKRWNVESVHKLVHMLNVLCKNDVPREASKEFFLKIVSDMMSLKTEPRIRDNLIEVALMLCSIISVSELTGEEFQKFLQDVYIKYIPAIVQLKDSNYSNWHKMWIFLVKFSGKKIHESMDLTNRLLRIVEFAFRNSSFEQRLRGYDCWKELIDNASLDPNHICTSKQIKLLITPLRAKFSKQEIVICKRFDVFVYLLEKLQKNAILCLPEFLEFCFGSLGDSKSGQAKSVPQIWLKSVKVLIAILGHSHPNNTECISEEINFAKPLIDGTNFEKFDKIVIHSVAESCVLLKDGILENKTTKVIKCLWKTVFNLIIPKPKAERNKYLDIVANILDKYLQQSGDPFFQDLFRQIFIVLIENDYLDQAIPQILKQFVTFSISTDAGIDFIDVYFKPAISQPFSKIVLEEEKLKMVDVILDCLQNGNVEDKYILNLAKVWIAMAGELNLYFDSEKFSRISGFKQFFVWPFQNLHRLEEPDRKQVVLQWMKLYRKLTIDNESNKIDSLKDLEKAFKNNPLLSSNTCCLLNVMSQFETKFSSEFVIKLMEVTYLVLELPNLNTEEENRLFSLVMQYFEASLECYKSENHEEIIKILCSCIGRILVMESGLKIVDPLVNFIKNSSLSVKNKFSKYLKDLSSDLYKKETDSNNLVKARELYKILSLFFDGTNKTSEEEKRTFVIPHGRSARIARMGKNSPSSPNKSKKTNNTLRLFGKDLETMSPLKLKGSQLNNSSPLTTKKGANVIEVKTPKNRSVNEENSMDFVPIDSEVTLQRDKLSEHQKEMLKKKREDIPALYQDLSQSVSQDIFSSKSNSIEPTPDVVDLPLGDKITSETQENAVSERDLFSQYSKELTKPDDVITGTGETEETRKDYQIQTEAPNTNEKQEESISGDLFSVPENKIQEPKSDISKSSRFSRKSTGSIPSTTYNDEISKELTKPDDVFTGTGETEETRKGDDQIQTEAANTNEKQEESISVDLFSVPENKIEEPKSDISKSFRFSRKSTGSIPSTIYSDEILDKIIDHSLDKNAFISKSRRRSFLSQETEDENPIEKKKRREIERLKMDIVGADTFFESSKRTRVRRTTTKEDSNKSVEKKGRSYKINVGSPLIIGSPLNVALTVLEDVNTKQQANDAQTFTSNIDKEDKESQKNKEKNKKKSEEEKTQPEHGYFQSGEKINQSDKDIQERTNTETSKPVAVSTAEKIDIKDKKTVRDSPKSRKFKEKKSELVISFKKNLGNLKRKETDQDEKNKNIALLKPTLSKEDVIKERDSTLSDLPKKRGRPKAKKTNETEEEDSNKSVERKGRSSNINIGSPLDIGSPLNLALTLLENVYSKQQANDSQTVTSNSDNTKATLKIKKISENNGSVPKNRSAKIIEKLELSSDNEKKSKRKYVKKLKNSPQKIAVETPKTIKPSKTHKKNLLDNLMDQEEEVIENRGEKRAAGDDENEDIIESSQDTFMEMIPLLNSSKKKSLRIEEPESAIKDSGKVEKIEEDGKTEEALVRNLLDELEGKIELINKDTGGDSKENSETNKCNSQDTTITQDNSTDTEETLTKISDYLDTFIHVPKTQALQKPQLTESELIMCQKDTMSVCYTKETLGSDNEKELEPINSVADILGTPSTDTAPSSSNTPGTPANIQSIPSSPVTVDTPNRTSELLDNTMDISPITSRSNSEENISVPCVKPLLLEVEILAEEIVTDDKKDEQPVEEIQELIAKAQELLNGEEKDDSFEECSSDDFENIDASSEAEMTPLESIIENQPEGIDFQSPSSNNDDNPIQNGQVSTTINMVTNSGFKEISMQERCKLQNFIQSIKPFNKRKGGTSSSPSAIRLKKLFINMGQKTINQEVVESFSDNDLLTFSREIPSPLAVPKSSILKRKFSDSSDGEGISPCAKRKRVNFSDPCLTSKKLFIKDFYQPSLEAKRLFDVTPDGKSADDDLKVIFDYPDGSPGSELSTETDSEIPETEPILTVVNPMTLQKNKPIFPKLVECRDEVLVVVKKLTTPMFIPALMNKLKGKNVKTIGDLAKLSESEVAHFPFKVPVVANVLKVLENYHKKKFGADTKSEEKVENSRLEEKQNGEVEMPKLDVKLEFKMLIKRAHREKVPTEELLQILLPHVENSKLCSVIKSHHPSISQDTIEEKDFTAILRIIIESKGISEILKRAHVTFHNADKEHDFYQAIAEYVRYTVPLEKFFKGRSIEDLEVGIEESIKNKVFQKNEIIENCLLPLIESPADITSYLNSLTCVEFSDMVVERLSGENPNLFFQRIIKRCSFEDQTSIPENLWCQQPSSPLELVACFKRKLELQSKDEETKSLVEMFNFISEKMDAKTLLELHVVFLNRISGALDTK